MQHVFSSRWVRHFIPNIGTLILVALMLVVYRASAAPGSPPIAPDATPGTISYQGMLNDAVGQPINGSTNITFRLYNVPTGGTALWTEAHTGANAVPVSNGLFNVLLGSLTPIPASVWSNANVYLGVQVGGDAEMSPREAVSVVPTAMTVPEGAIGMAQIASGAITTTKIADRAVTQEKAPTLIRDLVANGTVIQYGSMAEVKGDVWVTFPHPFNTTPFVFITQREAAGGSGGYVVSSVSNTGFYIDQMTSNWGYVQWLAIGQ